MGYRIIYLRRDTWSQTLSLTRAQTSRVYFTDHTAATAREVRIDPRKFLAALAWNERMLQYEDAVMAHVPHHRIQYETALRLSECHQRTVDDICTLLDLLTAQVATRMTRTGHHSTGAGRR